MRRLVSVLVNVALLLGLLPASPPPVEASHPTGTPRYVVTLSPATDTNTVGTEHCVTATVVDRHNPNNPAVRNTPVRFTVTGANPTTGTVTTNSRGDPVTFCYTGTRAGTDTITAYPDVDNDNVQDADEQPGTATKVWNPAVPNSVVLTPATDTNPTGQEHCVTAVATDAFGNVTPNVRVVFTVTGANPRPATVRTTNASGEATFCYTGTNVGVDTIRAFADRDNDGTLDVGEPIGMATKTYVAATPATVVVAPATDTNPAGQEHCVTATVRDASGNPISGVVVRFTVAGANSAGGTATTNAAGVASFCYTGTRIGTDTITATADGDRDGTPETGEPTGTATKIYAAAAPQTVVLSPATDENTVGQEHCVTATVTDAFGNVAADTRVRFTVTGANAASGTATTDEAGEAEFCYTGTASGLDTITAIADANRNGAYETSEPTGTATKTYHPGTPATVVLSPPADENVVGDRHCVQASVRDTFGNPVPNVAVVFEVEGANPTGPRTVRTDASGNAVFCYTGTASGADLISAYADTNGDGSRQTTEALATAAAKFYQAGTPATVAVTPPTDTNRAGEEHCVTATVEDAFGNPVEAGVLVRFTVEGANTAAGTDTTDANGQAEFCYTGERVGTDIITAIADGNDDGEAETGEPMGTATKLYGPADPAVLTLEPPTAENTVGEEHCVTATATDAFGNPTPGISIVFEVEGSNPEGPTAVETDASGQAEFCYTGEVAGLDTITAFADTNDSDVREETEPQAVATKLYQPGAAAAVTVTPPAATNTVGEEHCVTATVVDAFGNPVAEGTLVRFTVAGANTAGGTAETDENGDAEFCYTGTRAGADVITATADADGDDQAETGEPTGAAEKTYRPGQAAVVTVSPLTDTNRAGEEHCVIATVLDEFGNVVEEDTTVFFSVTGANSASGSATTDADGRAEFCYIGTRVGQDVILARADADRDEAEDAGEPSGMATKTYLAAEPHSVVLDPAIDENPAGEQHCVTATVRDIFGNPTPDETVIFEVEGANPRPPTARETDELGQATFCYTGTVAGADVITAYADENDDRVRQESEAVATASAKVYQPGDPATVVLNPPAAENRAGERHCVTATVEDAFGNPTPGIRVIFEVTGANDETGADTTDEFGQAEFCYTGTMAGADVITAFADSDGDRERDETEPEGAATKLYRPGRPATVEVTPATDVNRAGEQHCVDATVRDEFGNPVEAGVRVEFTVAGANSRTTVNRATDDDGVARFCYTGTVAGADTITAVADSDEDGDAEPGEATGVATKLYRPARPAAVQVEPAADTNRAGEQHCVTATVRDEFGNPVEAGVRVEFTVTGANPRPTAVRATDADGEAEFCYTGTVVGLDTITVVADSDEDGDAEPGEATGVAEKVYRPGRPATVTVTPLTDDNRVGEQHCVTATVRDEFANPVEAGIEVLFDVNGANADEGGIRATDRNGQAEFCYTGEIAGLDTITAIADSDEDGTAEPGEATGEATKLYRPGEPATVTVNPPADVNRAGEEHCVTATVRDIFGNPVEAGVAVEFQVVGANPEGPVIRRTDDTGVATFCYTGTVAGADAIRATADGDEDGTPEEGEPTGAAEKTYRPGRPAAVQVEPAADTNRAGEQHCVTATVRDEFGNPVEAGIAVEFDVNGVNDRDPVTRRTDDNGQAEFCYTGTAVGVDTITVIADSDEDGDPEPGEATGVAEKTYRPGQAAAVTVTPPADVNRAGEEHCVTATVVDEFGNPVEEDTIVRFEVTGANAAVGSDRTDELGRAEFCYTGTVAGVDVITATADRDEDGTAEDGEPSGAAEKTYRPARPFSVEVEPVAATNAAGEQHCVTATVRDEFGNPVEAGVAVEFTVIGANPRGPVIDRTDDDGVAEFCYTGTRVGVDVIRATADGDEDGTPEAGEPTGAAEKTYVPAEPATLTLSPKAAENRVGTQHCVTATVTDAFGNPTPTITVRFEVTGSVTTSGSAETDEAGQTTFCYMGPILPGQDRIHAFADTDEDGMQDLGEPFDEASKTWVLPPSTAFCEVLVTDGGWIIADNGDRGSFGGNARADGEGNVSGEQLYQDHGPAQPMTVKSTELLALTCNEDRTQADIYGRATIDGEGSFLFRISVRDLAEPGKRRDTYRITVSNGYDSGEHLLEGGNIQIH